MTGPLTTRRAFALSLMAGAAVAATAGRDRARIAIIGGGPAGAAAAIALRQAQPRAEILLIERDPARLANSPELPSLARPSGPDLAALRGADVEILIDDVTGIDWRAARLSLFSGRQEAFDRVIVAPGTAPMAEAIPGLDAVARHHWPAAWGRPREARRLMAQLSALPDNGHLVLRLPAEVSHPDIAVRRALDLATWVRKHRPSARFTVLDGGPDIHLRRAFMARAGDAANWLVSGAGGRVRAVNAPTGRIETDAGELFADVVNFIPPHGAGQIARVAGLTDATGWCPCDPTGRSAIRPEAQVLGDARRGVIRSADMARRSAWMAV